MKGTSEFEDGLNKLFKYSIEIYKNRKCERDSRRYGEWNVKI